MNRQTIVDGIRNADGTIGIGREGDEARGQQIAYDNAGNRTMMRQWGRHLLASTTQDYQGEGADRQYLNTYTTHWGLAEGGGFVTESYAYDAAGRLTDVMRDGVNIDRRRYDAGGRIVQSGLVIEGEQPGMRQALHDAGVATDLRISDYQDGQLLHQSVRGANHTDSVYAYDAAGRLDHYQLNTGGHASFYDYSYESSDRDKVRSIHVRRDDGKTATTTHLYDANGHLVHVQASASNEGATRALVNDAAGRVLRKTQDGHVTTTLIANGEVIGSSSDEQAAVAGTFRSSYVPIADASLTAGPMAYTVQAGDTLQSIAKAMWGNADLWFLIADANGINEAEAGQVIAIPAKSNTIYNDFDTFNRIARARRWGIRRRCCRRRPKQMAAAGLGRSS